MDIKTGDLSTSRDNNDKNKHKIRMLTRFLTTHTLYITDKNLFLYMLTT